MTDNMITQQGLDVEQLVVCAGEIQGEYNMGSAIVPPAKLGPGAAVSLQQPAVPATEHVPNNYESVDSARLQQATIHLPQQHTVNKRADVESAKPITTAPPAFLPHSVVDGVGIGGVVRDGGCSRGDGINNAHMSYPNAQAVRHPAATVAATVTMTAGGLYRQIEPMEATTADTASANANAAAAAEIAAAQGVGVTGGMCGGVGLGAAGRAAADVFGVLPAAAVHGAEASVLKAHGEEDNNEARARAIVAPPSAAGATAGAPLSPSWPNAPPVSPIPLFDPSAHDGPPGARLCPTNLSPIAWAAPVERGGGGVGGEGSGGGGGSAAGPAGSIPITREMPTTGQTTQTTRAVAGAGAGRGAAGAADWVTEEVTGRGANVDIMAQRPLAAVQSSTRKLRHSVQAAMETAEGAPMNSAMKNTTDVSMGDRIGGGGGRVTRDGADSGTRERAGYDSPQFLPDPSASRPRSSETNTGMVLATIWPDGSPHAGEKRGLGSSALTKSELGYGTPAATPSVAAMAASGDRPQGENGETRAGHIDVQQQRQQQMPLDTGRRGWGQHAPLVEGLGSVSSDGGGFNGVLPEFNGLSLEAVHAVSAAGVWRSGSGEADLSATAAPDTRP